MEIELRARISNPNKIEQKIINLGAKLIKNKKQTDLYFGEIGLYKKIGYSFLIRIRQEGDKIFMTYKGAQAKRDGVWEEYEFVIDDRDKGIKMVEAMGLEKIIEINKKRKEYKIDNITICLDNITNLGYFIEIESQNDNDINKEKLNKLMKQLDIDQKQIIHKGYVTILLKQNNSPYSKYIIN